MFRLPSWSAPLRLSIRSADDLVAFDALSVRTDPRVRRASRATDSARRLSILADYGVRTLVGRFPS